ncbi:glucose-6-phosphate dehydrogenase [Bacteroides sp. 519]|uniref:glucose-6-phosphate dehydrogenase n=1 Tax=Bacteroides sp. 519 TaxID=2302937 RepID=UPI0013D1B116|nr:glucose-6-phosphate dehydrogenase [Bacteroides sp. 519]NDV59656.1 glucose-6-phosphate dehydrogenase [Bacteroides sp. 519]
MHDRNIDKPLAIVIFGASGDLTKRKLMPALYSLFREKRLPGTFSVLGIGRTKYTDEDYRPYILSELKEFVKPEEINDKEINNFISHLHYLSMDPSVVNDYPLLSAKLAELTSKDIEGNILYYLATPPSLYGVIPQHLKANNLNGSNTRIIVEKPFGYDLKSAHELNAIYRSVFTENQIFRIDHFFGKETVQNILAFRFANGIFEPLWNRNYIDHIEITAVENMGIEQRGGYYNSSGALRDMVQNHLVQLLSLIAMEPPVAFNPNDFRNEILKVYESLAPLSKDDLQHNVIRGQYIASADRKGYREEKNIPDDSRTETYIAMKLNINNWRWSGVPFYIRTGKQMPTKVTEIVVHFRKAPHQMFKTDLDNHNMLIIRIQPNEGILLKVGMKVPGSGFEIREASLELMYDKLDGLPVGDAYARLIEDCILGDPTLFTRGDAVEASWYFFDAILKSWQSNTAPPLYGYPAGTWGPKESDTLMNTYNTKWTNPCKNLTNSDQYCEL